MMKSKYEIEDYTIENFRSEMINYDTGKHFMTISKSSLLNNKSKLQ